MKNLARVAVSGIVGVGLMGVGVMVVPQAAAESPCIPETMAMSPQPVLSCPGQVAAPFPKSAPLPAPGAPPSGNGLPAPGQAPYIPPVTNQDGTQTTFDQGGYLGDLWGQFHNGVPSDLIYGPPVP
ncbi:hypothetical protein [Mycobacterium sp. ACS4331]|uniref:hypothetical protein n=1 Tax=Mycobacterium sp. ACS4331 TaxID=1834121 RepID=UPI000801C909|nr:hypothetical protein [Mycobacterium sp. ACS4331]OBF20648.1 hypothetical protein A5727_09100 [Mycobacterium sp. ACS4331]